jgi:hypothetical protein
VDENVFRALAAGEKAEAARAIEPFHDNDLKRADGGGLRAGTRERHGNGRRLLALIHRQHPEHL